MILSFTLTMPNRGSWDGRWSGEDNLYVITRTFLGRKQNENAAVIRDTGYYHYSWGDGWAAGIHVKKVTSSEAAALRKKSKGFCGYEWMVDSIIKYGEPLAKHEVEKKLGPERA